MKKKLLILVLSLVSISINSQVNLDHTFANTNYYSGLQVVNDNNSTFYCKIDEVNRQVKLYNMNYTIYKTINLQVGDKYKSGSLMCYLFSTKLFNNDEKIEFLVSFGSGDTEISGNYKLFLYNEDGVVIKDFGDYIVHHDCPPVIIKTSTNEIKLILTKTVVDKTTTNWIYSYNTDIYSLQGSLSALVPAESIQQNSFAYPNPSSTIITLPYVLSSNESAYMKIYNSNGLLIEQKNIDSSFDKILLDVSTYAAGVYIYDYNGKSNRFIVK